MRSQEEYVLRTVEERGIRFVQLWFTDVLGTPKTFSITPAELENALDEGMTFDGSAIDGFSRVQESDVLARPDANTFQLLPWHGHGQAGLNGDDPRPRWPGCSATSSTSTARRSRAIPATSCVATLDRAHDLGFTFYAAPEIEFFYFADGDPAKPPGHPRLGLLLRADGGRPGQRHPPAHRAHPRGDGHPRRARPARGLAQPARDRPALHRRPDHGRHGHDRAPGGQGDGPPAGRVRQLHAQAAGRRAGLGHAHPHVPVPRATPTPSSTSTGPAGSPRWPRGSSPACCATPPRSPRSPTSGSTPTSGWCPATRPPSTCRGPATTAPPWCGCRWSSRASSSPPGSSTARRTAPATRTWPSP